MLYAYIFVSEIYSTIILIFSLLFFTFLSQRKKFLKDLNKFSWFIILILSIFYFLSLLTSNTNIFYLSCGIYSNSVLYALRLVLSFIFIFYILYLKTELKNFVFYSYEFFIILFFSFLSLNMLLLSSNFINIFIFLEFFSICTFYLLSAQKTYEKSLEASIKYFIFSSLASAIFLFGMFLIYYSTGINDLFELLLLSTNNLFLTNNTIYIVGAILICFGLIFKIGAGIFFFWIVDVYEGINYPMLIFLNIFVKVVYLFLLFFFLNSLNIFLLKIFIEILVFFTAFFSLIGAIYQVKVKKFLIFTSIYNITFFSINFWNFNEVFTSIFIFFCIFYLLNSLILLIIFTSIKDWNSNMVIKNIMDLTNLLSQNKILAYILSISLFTNAGLPPATLFFAKFFILFEVYQTFNFLWFSLLFFFSIVSFFYYIRLIRIIFFSTPIITIFLKPIPTTVCYILSFFTLFNLLFVFFFDKILFIIDFFFY